MKRLGDSPAAVARRQERVVAAAVRAAYAWSERSKHPEAMREIARMTGVVMEARGRGYGPTAPMHFLELLQQPLGKLLSFAGPVDEAVSDAILLDGHGRVTDAVYDVGCEYAQQLDAALETAGWLPSWARMRGEQVQTKVFAALVESGDQQAYVRGRRFLIEHPAGQREEIATLLAGTGTRCAAEYHAIPSTQVHSHRGQRWWWPCPACRWPMFVTGEIVRCRYRPHRAVYQIVSAPSSRALPRLQRIEDDGPAPSRCRPAEAAACVDVSVWRHIVVPGATELRIASEWESWGAAVTLWPDFDSYDLDVLAGTTGFRFDVKEYRSTRRLIDDLRARRPTATVILPTTHEAQLDILRDAMPGLSVTTEKRARRQVRQATREPQ